jgi:hypothetical protein
VVAFPGMRNRAATVRNDPQPWRVLAATNP